MGRLKDFAVGVLEIPGTMLFGLSKLVFGATNKYEDGKVRKDKEGRASVFPGLLGLVLGGIGALGRGISNSVENHKKAISFAFWASLGVGGLVGLALYAWPAALTFVANYAIYGYSIAGLVGTEPLLQMGFAAGLAFTATSAATYAIAIVANFISAIKNACNPQPETPEETTPSQQESLTTDSPRKLMKGLNAKPSTAKNNTTVETTVEPTHTTNVYKKPTDELVEEENLTEENGNSLKKTA